MDDGRWIEPAQLREAQADTVYDSTYGEAIQMGFSAGYAHKLALSLSGKDADSQDSSLSKNKNTE